MVTDCTTGLKTGTVIVTVPTVDVPPGPVTL